MKSNRELFIQGDCQPQQIRESETWTARWCSTSNTPPSVVPTYSTLDRRRSEEWGWRPGRQRHRHRWSERSQASSCLRSRDRSSRKIACNWDFQFEELIMTSLPKDDVIWADTIKMRTLQFYLILRSDFVKKATIGHQPWFPAFLQLPNKLLHWFQVGPLVLSGSILVNNRAKIRSCNALNLRSQC